VFLSIVGLRNPKLLMEIYDYAIEKEDLKL
jgi:hypothetical protein